MTKITKKILIGDKDVVTRTIEDEYVDIELSTEISDIRTDKFDNVFNINSQFIKDRNASLKFCMYGVIESKFGHCEGLDVTATLENFDGLHEYDASNPIVANIFQYSEHLTKGGAMSKNLFGYNRGRYVVMFEIDKDALEKYESEALAAGNRPEPVVVRLVIQNVEKHLLDVAQVPIIVYDSDGNRAELGTLTTEIDEDGNTIEISNDWPFFYDRHWIKRTATVERYRQANFSSSSYQIKENEGTLTIGVFLDTPSRFGVERLLVTATGIPPQNPNSDFDIPQPELIWKVGDQYKEIVMTINDDLYVEDNEVITLGFEGMEFVDNGDAPSSKVTIENDDVPININFEQSTIEMVEESTTLTFKVSLEAPMNVENQHVDVVIDHSVSNVLANRNYIPTEGTSFRKTLEFNYGEQEKEFTLELLSDGEYDVTKILVLAFDAATPNIIGGPRPTCTLKIKDNTNVSYVAYNIPGSRDLGEGIFRTTKGSFDNFEKLRWREKQGKNSVTGDFFFKMAIINRGVNMVYADRLIGPGEIVVEKDFANGFEGFRLPLPANRDKNDAENRYERAQYEVQFNEIQPVVEASTKIEDQYDDVVIFAEALTAPSTKDQVAEAYLTTKISNIRCRIGREQIIKTALFDQINVGIQNFVNNAKEVLKGGPTNALNQAKSVFANAEQRVINARNNLQPLKDAIKSLQDEWDGYNAAQKVTHAGVGVELAAKKTALTLAEAGLSVAENIFEAAQSTLDAAKDAFDRAINALSTIFNFIVEGTNGLFKKGVDKTIDDDESDEEPEEGFDLKSFISNGVADIKAKARDIAQPFVNLFTGLFDKIESVVKDILEKIIGFVTDILKLKDNVCRLAMSSFVRTILVNGTLFVNKNFLYGTKIDSRDFRLVRADPQCAGKFNAMLPCKLA